MENLQNLLDELSDGWRAKRSLSQMTLGRLISELEKFPKDKMIENYCEPHSYRGYYSDLAIESHDGSRTVSDFLSQLKTECLGQVFTGYKGGDFYMDEHTPLWIAEYGSCGMKIMGLRQGDILSFDVADDD